MYEVYGFCCPGLSPPRFDSRFSGAVVTARMSERLSLVLIDASATRTLSDAASAGVTVLAR